jgi:hypothetical protein
MNQQLLYPKKYGTVRAQIENLLQVQMDDDDRTVVLDMRWRNGKGSRQDFGPGTRVKVYQCPDRGHLKFRRQGA